MTDENGGDSPESNMAGARNWTWWFQMALYSVAILGGQTSAVLLGRLYFENGGKSNWIASLVQTIGFPLFLPFLLITSFSKTSEKEKPEMAVRPPLLFVGKTYIFLGVFLAGISWLYSVGLQNLSVSTFTLVSASQLAFSSFFGIFLNSHKITPFILNSLVLVTTSTVLQATQNDQFAEGNKAGARNHLVGIVCTIAASAGHALILCLTELVFQKVVKRRTFRFVLEMTIWESVVATAAILIGLFVSGDWRSVKAEMEGFKLGGGMYVASLVCTAISWEIFNVGCYGLIFKASSLFSNVMDSVSLPVVTVVAVMFFHDKMTGVKVISLLLAVWGFLSYLYQQYLDCYSDKQTQGQDIPLASVI